jgi:hypothetical protein
MIGIFGLQRTNQQFKFGKSMQILETMVFQKNGQHANPLLTLRSSHAKAVSRLPVKAKMQAI